jgi:hypothetical protein
MSSSKAADDVGGSLPWAAVVFIVECPRREVSVSDAESIAPDR